MTITNAAPAARVHMVALGVAVIAGVACSVDGQRAVDAGDGRGDAVADAAVDAHDAPAVVPDADVDVGADAPVGEAGGDAAPAMLPFASGSRLRARWSATTDGRRVFAGWFDSQLAADCFFTTTTDGELRCLPGSATILSAFMFADSACTAQLVHAGKTVPNLYYSETTCTPPEFVRQGDYETPCNPRWRVFRRGPEVPGGMIFTKPPTGCQPTFLPLGTTAYGLGDELPPTSFVKASRVARPASPAAELHPVYLEAEDGARQPVGWRPSGSDEDCRLLTLDDQRLHCVTSVGQAGATFADASCNEPTGYAQSCRPLPTFVPRLEPGACPLRQSIHRIGARLDRVYSTLFTGTCTAAAAGTSYYALGSAVPADTFPTVAEMDDAVGRLRRRFQVGPGGMVANAWYDSERAMTCRPFPFGDKLRCVPDGEGLSALYADPNCTIPVKHGERSECRPRFTFSYHRTCPVRGRAYEVGAPHGGAVFQMVEDGSQNPPRESCQPHDRRPDFDYYQVAEIPESELPELQRVMD